MKRVVIAAALVACSDPASNDVVGPFRGEVHRFVIDRLDLPKTSEEVRAMGDDLDGDDTVDNNLGNVLSALAIYNDVTTHSADMIASGALASTIEIQATDLEADDHVGLTYFGRDGDPATVVGGRIVDGAFHPNPTRSTRAPGAAVARIPIFTNADPVGIPVVGLEVSLVPDGLGGFDGFVRGGILEADAKSAAYGGIIQMILARPGDHLPFARLVDLDRDGMLSPDELAMNDLLLTLLSPDLNLFAGTSYAPSPALAGQESVSFGFGIHLAPCPSGRCNTATPMQCHDRIVDGDETDIDCGGSCAPCEAGAACVLPTDCQTAGCDALRCRAATCTDGVKDGLESDVDCGANCPGCGPTQRCADNLDCASNACGGSLGATGACS